ncbi:flavin reductase family protein [Rhodopila sp.]|uniref:flavin reductase family protein n=1 Tax=Rhodopila sp. TaxID=2480087 RepID=UPI003D0D8DC8
MHQVTHPAILYFGTPVVLISTVNEDGSANLAPMSSAWWLGQRCILGLAAMSKTTQNLLRTGECVLNLPSDSMAAQVDRIARTTGSDPVPEGKARRGYRHVGGKFEVAGLTPTASLIVKALRVMECPVQLEAELEAVHPIAEKDPIWRGRSLALHVVVRNVHAATDVLTEGEPDRIDPDKWRPLIISFQHFYGLASGKLCSSELAKIPEAAYRA